jgi:hypothetical protein
MWRNGTASGMQLLRYVVLHHTGHGEPHYDLMFETAPGSALATWRCSSWPVIADERLVRLGEHRRDYLSYEGPVSRNRGHVRRIEEGCYELIAAEDNSFKGRLRDGRTFWFEHNSDAEFWAARVDRSHVDQET